MTQEETGAPEIVIWQGRTGQTKVLLFPQTLVVARTFWKRVELDLKDIQKVRVVQRFFGRIFGRGDLWIESQGTKGPILIRGLRNPYEGWKQIKIAAFQRRKTC